MADKEKSSEKTDGKADKKADNKKHKETALVTSAGTPNASASVPEMTITPPKSEKTKTPPKSEKTKQLLLHNLANCSKYPVRNIRTDEKTRAQVILLIERVPS